METLKQVALGVGIGLAVSAYLQHGELLFSHLMRLRKPMPLEQRLV
jgi:hypothetical protein